MQLRLPVFALLLITACGGPQTAGSSLEVGSKAPTFDAVDHGGQSVSLGNLHRDGPVVLTFLRSFY